jgi:hypothetical protein
MSAILRKSSFFYITHLCTFVVPPLFMLAGSLKNRAVLSVMTLWIPVWLSSSVLWSERQEAYAFLRILPVTDRRIVRAKFGLVLGFAAVYWLVIFVFIRAAWGSTPEYDGYLAWATLACAAALVLTGGWLIVSWRFGQNVLTGAVMAFVAIGILSTWFVDVKRRVRAGGIGGITPGWLAEAPWFCHVLLVAAALAAFYGLMRLGIRVKTRSEA